MKTIIKILVNAIAVYITAHLLHGVHLTGFWGAVIVAAVLALLNATLRPLLVLLTLPATILSLGLFLLAINAFVIMAASYLLDDFKVDGFWWALLFSIILSFINSILEGIVGIKEQPNNDN